MRRDFIWDSKKQNSENRPVGNFIWAVFGIAEYILPNYRLSPFNYLVMNSVRSFIFIKLHKTAA